EHLEIYGWLYSYQRVRLLNLLGMQKQDALRAESIPVYWLAVLIGAHFGRPENLEELVRVDLGGKCPPDMHPDEFLDWIQNVAEMVPERDEAEVILKNYLDGATAELQQQLAAVEQREADQRAIAVDRARIELTPEGNKLLQYQLGNYRAFDATQRRIERMQTPKEPKTGRK